MQASRSTFVLEANVCFWQTSSLGVHVDVAVIRRLQKDTLQPNGAKLVFARVVQGPPNKLTRYFREKSVQALSRSLEDEMNEHLDV